MPSNILMVSTLNPDFSAQLHRLRDELGMTETEMANTAYSLLAWSVLEIKKGRIVASVDEGRMKYQELAMPFVDKIKK